LFPYTTLFRSPPANHLGWLGQIQQAAALQPLQGDTGVGRLPAAGGASPIQPLAQLARQSASRQRTSSLVEPRNQFWTEFSPTNNHRPKNEPMTPAVSSTKVVEHDQPLNGERAGVRGAIDRD